MNVDDVGYSILRLMAKHLHVLYDERLAFGV